MSTRRVGPRLGFVAPLATSTTLAAPLVNLAGLDGPPEPIVATLRFHARLGADPPDLPDPADPW